MATTHLDPQTFRGGLATSLRIATQDATVTIEKTDTVILLDSSDANAKAIATGDAFQGQRATLVLTTYASTGSYTLAVARGAASLTVTLNAAGEGCSVIWDGASWQLLDLIGGATAA